MTEKLYIEYRTGSGDTWAGWLAIFDEEDLEDAGAQNAEELLERWLDDGTLAEVQEGDIV